MSNSRVIKDFLWSLWMSWRPLKVDLIVMSSVLQILFSSASWENNFLTHSIIFFWCQFLISGMAELLGISVAF